MKLPFKIATSLTRKRCSKLFLLLVVSTLPLSASFGQSITVNVNSYLKEQAKKTALKGTMLVAENMTDWFSEPVSSPVTVKPMPKKTTKPIIIRCQTPVKIKCLPASSVSKRI